MNNDAMKFSIFMANLAADSLRKGETRQQWLDRLVALRQHVESQIESLINAATEEP